ncbi:AAA family ATPase [Blastopirellula retiformator]|uniref:Uncharacterized protein n=1 Tax=Blastopirellula retiformator TaxID=2527970 RepID=A0A5C5V0X8_9BACT|nr:AAA family ATPase [Blastopirellula retiformator]TWT31392.1 hypothetical protein Enr8_33130 [Blastopirellula retiformator]
MRRARIQKFQTRMRQLQKELRAKETAEQLAADRTKIIERLDALTADDSASKDIDFFRSDVGGGDEAKETHRTLSTAEMLAEKKPQEWLFPNLLTKNEPAVIVGPSKTLKSSLAVDLCAALATGGKFLGEFAAEKVFRVGFVGADNKQSQLTDLAVRWSAARKENPTLDNLQWFMAVEEPATPEHLESLREWIEKFQLEVVVIDPLRLGSTNKRKQAEAIQTLVKTISKAGATPILCVQTRKEMKPGKLDASILAGSLDFAQQWLLVNRREAFESGSGQHKLWLSIGGYAGQGGEWGVDIDEGKLTDDGGRRWNVTLREATEIEAAAKQAKEDVKFEKLESQLRRVLLDAGENGLCKYNIRSNSGMSGSKFGPTWDRMMTAGKIVEMPKEPHSTLKRYTLPPENEKNETERSSRSRRVRCADHEPAQQA